MTRLFRNEIKLKISAIFICLICGHFAQSQSADNSVDVVINWQKGESHGVKIKITNAETQGNGNIQNSISTLDARFKVIEMSENQYKVEWTYSKSALSENDAVVENQILTRLLNVKMIVNISDVGLFVELVNVNDVRSAADKILDQLISSSTSNPALNLQYKAVKQMISSKQGLEIALLKPIKFYHMAFGFNYPLNDIQENKIKIPSPISAQPFDATQKVYATFDKSSSICTIKTDRIADGNQVKSVVNDYLKKVSPADGNRVAGETGKTDLGFSENIIQQIDLSKGLVLKSSIKRTLNFGFQSRVTETQMETVD